MFSILFLYRKEEERDWFGCVEGAGRGKQEGGQGRARAAFQEAGGTWRTGGCCTRERADAEKTGGRGV